MAVRLRHALGLGLLVLSGCTTAVQAPGPPWPVLVSPDLITLRWYPDEVSDQQALQVASGHCASYGRRAAVQGSEQSGSVRIVTYRCS